MDYIDSKTKLNAWIFGELAKHIPKDEWNGMCFMDGCAGSCSVSKYALVQGFKKVISNDLFEFSSAIIKGFSNFDTIRDGFDITRPQRKKDIEIQRHIDHINSIDGTKGFFHDKYSESAGRKFFTDDNAMRIDAARTYIDTISNRKVKEYILYIALEGLSAVMNTTGVQAAFLKKIKPRALNPFFVKIQPSYKGSVKVCNRNLIEIAQIVCDVLYIDPPYNSRQYGPNYHLYETFIKYDNPGLITRVAGLRDWHSESKSDFCSKRTCADVFRKVIEKSSAKLTMISYSSDGLMPENELFSLCKETYPNTLICKRKQNRYKADNSRKNDESVLEEFLFVLKK